MGGGDLSDDHRFLLYFSNVTAHKLTILSGVKQIFIIAERKK